MDICLKRILAGTLLRYQWSCFRNCQGQTIVTESKRVCTPVRAGCQLLRWQQLWHRLFGSQLASWLALASQLWAEQRRLLHAKWFGLWAEPSIIVRHIFLHAKPAHWPSLALHFSHLCSGWIPHRPFHSYLSLFSGAQLWILPFLNWASYCLILLALMNCF